MSLTVRNLTKSYGNKLVVDHLGFEMKKPGVYALLGTNGAGKTTSIRMMLDMLSRDEGEVLWNGSPLSTDKCNVGYLAEERGLYPKYQLLDQLQYFASLRGVSKEEAKKRIRYWSSRLNADEYLYPVKPARKSAFAGLSRKGDMPAPDAKGVPAASMRADQLSKGNQQKVQLVTAVLHLAKNCLYLLQQARRFRCRCRQDDAISLQLAAIVELQLPAGMGRIGL